MDETLAMSMWLKLDSLYMTKSLSNKFYMKKYLYSLWMTDRASILDHLSVFSKIICGLLCVDVKLEEVDKALLLCSLSMSYDHLVNTILYGKEKLEMEEIISTLVSNEI